jgi:xylose isomerase
MNTLHPAPVHRFSFGLWSARHQHRDPRGEVARPPIDPYEFVHRLAEVGGWGVSVDDDELVPLGSAADERDTAVERLRSALDSTGMVVSITTTNLYSHPVFREGAFSASDRDVRRFAVQKAMRAIDVGAELGAATHAFKCGRGDSEAFAAKPVADSLARYREAVDFLCGYVSDRGYGTRIALEPGQDDALLPTVGHALAFIATLDQPDMVGLSPAVAPEREHGPPRRGVYPDVAQAIDAGKLFHISLNAQRSDQDLRFGYDGLKDAFFLVKLLEDSGYDGARHFDTDQVCAQDIEGASDFAVACMRTYLALAAKARRFADDPHIQDALAECGATALADATVGRFTPEAADVLAHESFDPDVLAKQGHRSDHLDQLVVELIMGLR